MTAKEAYLRCAPKPGSYPDSRLTFMDGCIEALTDVKLYKGEFADFGLVTTGGRLPRRMQEEVSEIRVFVSPWAVATLMIGTTSALLGVFVWLLLYGLFTNLWILHWSVSIWGIGLSVALFATVAAAIRGRTRSRG